MNNAEQIAKLEQNRQSAIAKIRGDENAMHWVSILAKRALPSYKHGEAVKGIEGSCHLLGLKASVHHRRAMMVDGQAIFFNEI